MISKIKSINEIIDTNEEEFNELLTILNYQEKFNEIDETNDKALNEILNPNESNTFIANPQHDSEHITITFSRIFQKLEKNIFKILKLNEFNNSNYFNKENYQQTKELKHIDVDNFLTSLDNKMESKDNMIHDFTFDKKIYPINFKLKTNMKNLVREINNFSKKKAVIINPNFLEIISKIESIFNDYCVKINNLEDFEYKQKFINIFNEKIITTKQLLETKFINYFEILMLITENKIKNNNQIQNLDLYEKINLLFFYKAINNFVLEKIKENDEKLIILNSNIFELSLRFNNDEIYDVDFNKIVNYQFKPLMKEYIETETRIENLTVEQHNIKEQQLNLQKNIQDIDKNIIGARAVIKDKEEKLNQLNKKNQDDINAKKQDIIKLENEIAIMHNNIEIKKNINISIEESNEDLSNTLILEIEIKLLNDKINLNKIKIKKYAHEIEKLEEEIVKYKDDIDSEKNNLKKYETKITNLKNDIKINQKRSNVLVEKKQKLRNKIDKEYFNDLKQIINSMNHHIAYYKKSEDNSVNDLIKIEENIKQVNETLIQFHFLNSNKEKLSTSELIKKRSDFISQINAKINNKFLIPEIKSHWFAKKNTELVNIINEIVFNPLEKELNTIFNNLQTEVNLTIGNFEIEIPKIENTDLNLFFKKNYMKN